MRSLGLNLAAPRTGRVAVLGSALRLVAIALPCWACSTGEEPSADGQGSRGDVAASAGGRDSTSDSTGPDSTNPSSMCGSGGAGASDFGGNGGNAGSNDPDAGGPRCTEAEVRGTGLCPWPLPAEMAFCEDFESGCALATLVDSEDSGSANVDMAIVDSEATSGTHSLQNTIRAGQRASGGSISFRFDAADPADVYVRVRVKFRPPWPAWGAGELIRLEADNGSPLPPMEARLTAYRPDTTVLIAEALSCGTARCEGATADTIPRQIAEIEGLTPISGPEDSGAWHCVELHVRLNELGESDGALEFWVNGNLEGSMSGLDWRGTWDDPGPTHVTLASGWRGAALDPPPSELRRWLDDIVVSSERIGCD
jgi:hypothetical protein